MEVYVKMADAITYVGGLKGRDTLLLGLEAADIHPQPQKKMTLLSDEFKTRINYQKNGVHMYKIIEENKKVVSAILWATGAAIVFYYLNNTSICGSLIVFLVVICTIIVIEYFKAR